MSFKFGGNYPIRQGTMFWPPRNFGVGTLSNGNFPLQFLSFFRVGGSRTAPPRLRPRRVWTKFHIKEALDHNHHWARDSWWVYIYEMCHVDLNIYVHYLQAKAKNNTPASNQCSILFATRCQTPMTDLICDPLCNFKVVFIRWEMILKCDCVTSKTFISEINIFTMSKVRLSGLCGLYNIVGWLVKVHICNLTWFWVLYIKMFRKIWGFFSGKST